MDNKTLTALKESIEHWKDIKKDSSIETSSDDCALCQLTPYVCSVTCPAYFGNGYCKGTPYIDYVEYMFTVYIFGEDEKVRQDLAQKEIDFLISLLPKENKKKSIWRVIYEKFKRINNNKN